MQVARIAPRDAWQGAFDTVIELRSTDYARSLSRTGRTLCLAQLPEYGGTKHMVERVVDIAANVLHLRDPHAFERADGARPASCAGASSTGS